MGDQGTTNITFTITDDAENEGDETFTFRVAGRNSSTNARFSHDVTLTIVDNDPPGLTVTPSVVDESAGTVTFTATLDGTALSTPTPTQFSYATAVHTGATSPATPGTDYVTTSGGPITLNSANSFTTTFTVDITDDVDDEQDETFLVSVTSPNSSIAGASTTVTIRDDDGPPTLTASFDVSRVEETAGRVEFLLTLDGTLPSKQVQYELNTVDGTATAGQDYVALSQNSLSATVSTGLPSIVGAYFITITDDGDTEGPEYFTIRLTSRNRTVQVLEHRVTINDDEAPASPTDIPILVESSNHLIAQTEALLDTQPRLAGYAGDTGAAGSDFTLRVSNSGLEALDGGVAGNGFWGEAAFSRSGSRGAEGDHAVLSLGAHRQVSDLIVLGGMLQFDRTGTKLEGDGRSGEFSSKGWMAGPYVVARDPSRALFLEGRLLYGRASHDADAVVAEAGDGPRDGAFDSERWIAQARVEGEYPLGAGTIMYPLADLSHARNAGDGFDESSPDPDMDLDHEVRTSVSKLQLGAEFNIPLDSAIGDLVFRPGLKLVFADRKGVAFGKTDLSTSGRVDLGIDYSIEDNVSLGFQSYYSGIGGGSEFETYGAGLGLRMEF